MVVASMIFQAILQLGGVASVLPFLSVAAHPEGFATSKFGAFLMSTFHITDPKQLVYVTGTLAIFSLLLASGSAIASQVIVARYVGVSWTLAADAAPFQVLQSALSRTSFPATLRSSQRRQMRTSYVFTSFLLSPLCDFAARLFTTVVIIAGLLVLEPVVTLVAAAFFGCFYVLFMSLTRQRVRTINEMAKETSQSLSRLVQQFISGMRDIKLRDAGSYFINKIDEISESPGEGGSDERVDRRTSAQLDRAASRLRAPSFGRWSP